MTETSAKSPFHLPGMVNLHSHAFQRGMAGLAERAGTGDDSFWTWRDVMYRFLDHLTPDDVEAIATLAYVEMLEAGFTRVVEFHNLHHDANGRPYANVAEMAERIAAAASATGIRLTLLPVLYTHGGFGGQTAAARHTLRPPQKPGTGASPTRPRPTRPGPGPMLPPGSAGRRPSARPMRPAASFGR